MTQEDVQALAAAFGVGITRLTDPRTSSQPHHCLGLWNCQDEGFYRFVYRQVRTSEGPDWLTNDRTPAQLQQWWSAYQEQRHATRTPPPKSR